MTGSIQAAGWLCLTAMIFSVPAVAEGNRYGFPREYKSDISPVVAHQELTKNKKAVLIDVRSVEEFAAGHPPMADHIPYPTARGRGRDDANLIRVTPEEFLADILAKIPDKSTPIITMCSGGGRSAMAANILAKAGYSNVRSIWTGYNGQVLKDNEGKPVDVNANGVVGGVTLGPDGKPIEDMGDMDGWAGFHQLPTTTEISRKRTLARYRDMYPGAKR